PTAPGLGASENPYPQAREWQVSLSYRGLRSDRHYNGSEEQTQRQDLHNNVVNIQRTYDLGLTYAVNRQFSLNLGIPFVQASWSIPLPAQPPLGPRREQDAQGIGDVSVLGRYWIRNVETHGRGNFALGFGVKAPTGDYDATDIYPGLNGQNPTRKAVDQSIQPGDGGWGIILDFQGFKRIGKTVLLGSCTYLATPRDTNGSPTILIGLCLAANP